MSTSRTPCRLPSKLALLAASSLLLAQTSRSVWDVGYSAEQAKRGEAVYASEWSACHGIALNGGESAPPLTGGEFDFHNPLLVECVGKLMGRFDQLAIQEMLPDIPDCWLNGVGGPTPVSSAP